MINFVLCSSVSSSSGRALARSIAELQGRKCRYYCRDFPRRPLKRHIRYGSVVETSGNCINSIESVRLAADKFQSALTLQNYGVLTPRVLQDNDCAVPYERVFRKSNRHAGNDSPMYLAKGSLPGEVLRGYDYAVEYIIKTAEYRVHVVCGKVVRVQQKKRIRDFSGRDRRIWSEPNGWCLVECEAPDMVLPFLAKNAIQTLGLDFGAVDMIKSKKDNRYYVLEVNTAPGITCGGVEKYASAFVQWDRGNRECF